jgi:hypothetical protein
MSVNIGLAQNSGLAFAVGALTRAAPVAPVVSVTPTGPIQLEQGHILVAPTPLGLLRTQEAHYRATNTPVRSFHFPEFASMTTARAFTAYSNAVVCGLAQLATIPAAGQQALLSAMLDFADVSGTLAGLEGVFLTAVRSAQTAGNTALVDRAEQVWAKADASGPIGGGALTVPVLDTSTGQLALLTASELGQLGLGAGSRGQGASRANGRTAGPVGLAGLQGLGHLGGLGGTGIGLNRVGGLGDGLAGLGGMFAGSGPGAGPGDQGLASDYAADYAAKGSAIGGTLGLIGGAAYGFFYGIPAGPAAGVAGAFFGGAMGATLGSALVGGGGLIVGALKDSAASKPAPGPENGDGPDTEGQPAPGPGPGGQPAPGPGPDSEGQPAPGPGPGPDSEGQPSGSPSPGGTRGGQSGGDLTGGHDGRGGKSGDSPLSISPDPDSGWDGDSGQDSSDGISEISALIPSGPGLGSLTNYEGGASFLINGLPRYEEDGAGSYGFLGVAGARVIEAAFGGQVQAGVDTAGVQNGRSSIGSLSGPATTGLSFVDTTGIKTATSSAEILQSAAQQLLALADQARRTT